ncbi:MAG: tRNA pseudouridine(38-40) synthase TruA [Rickettsiaceae bacterium]|nr:MAG: tRNA pseudouridine(38-40) synthase TruA [Rickettsiaceae bacterium]
MQKHRYKIDIEYIGTNISGWQRQENAISIQQIIEIAISKFSHEEVVIHAAGRTDAGVHAMGQVAHFDLTQYYLPNRVMQAINYFVRPHLVAITKCILVDDSFHARFSAISRHYMYRIINRCGKIVIDQDRAWWIRQDLDIKLMNEAAIHLLGKHDFTSFRAQHCQALSPVKTISELTIHREDTEITIHISAPSFLYHMVRNIVGSLTLVGIGKYRSDYIKKGLEAKNRAMTGPTAPACGLYFMKVDY